MSNLNAAAEMFDVHKWFHDLVGYYGKPVMNINNWSSMECDYRLTIFPGNASCFPAVEYCPICGKSVADIIEFREKVSEPNRRAEQARKDGYEVLYGKVYEKGSLEPNEFPRFVCSVMEYGE